MSAFAWFWTVMIFVSIGWYSFLLFWLGIKGGFEIYRMTQILGRPRETAAADPQGPRTGS